MRFRTDQPIDLHRAALSLVSLLVVTALVVLVGQELIDVQIAALEQCQPHCHLGAPPVAVASDSLLVYLPALGLLLGATAFVVWVAPKVAPLRRFGGD